MTIGIVMSSLAAEGAERPMIEVDTNPHSHSNPTLNPTLTPALALALALAQNLSQILARSTRTSPSHPLKLAAR